MFNTTSYPPILHPGVLIKSVVRRETISGIPLLVGGGP